MTNAHIIIPARFKSSRFPGKPLKKILGKEMIIRVAEICAKIISLKKIIIATDSLPIMKVCQKHGYQSLITPKNCKTGTDRVFHVAKKIKSDFYINVQGDEPLVNPSDIRKIINAKKKFPNHVICGYAKISALENSQNRNIPKVVMNKKNELIYISRANIPSTKNKNKKIDYFKQVCVYAFNKNELKEFYKFKQKSKLEKIEDIEILRFFELNIKIKMIKLNKNTIAVDEKKDIYKVEKILKR